MPKTSPKPNNKSKKELNYRMTIEGMQEHYDKLTKLKEKKKKRAKEKEDNPEMLFGIELLYRILEKENLKMLAKLQREFREHIDPGVNVRKLLKPPYLVPEIVSHKIEKALNDY